ncbi:hybrid sensor histidine kinase/response regulator [Pseudogemmobacter sonorensis]|uniref:hybrid sensor histidine kinase/response regulator n=1 Tax=Pseudogemmobacter sonorensis TaxID=2989681 RepID=UPI0036ADCF6A
MIPSRLVDNRSGNDAFDAGPALELLAAVIATDSRGTAVFAANGELLLANAVAGAATVAMWHDFGKSSDWERACREAQAAGSARINLESGEISHLHPIPGESGQPRFWLMRLSSEAGTAEERSLSERITDMAHDLRAPLQSLIIAADGLSADGAQDARGAELGALAQLAVDQVGNLLETVRMEQVSAETEPRVIFDLVAVVRDMARLLEPICQRSGNFILTELPEGEAWFSGAPQLVRAILQNLITNANRFNMNGPITVRLRLAPAEGDFERLATIEVEDVGPGLSEAERQLVLTPGARRASAPTDKGGYGLGLGIVSRAIGRLRGKAEVGPGKECGTLFRTTFPLTVSRAPGEQSKEGDEAVSLAGLRILVVEDNPVNLAILLRTLTDAGAEAEGVVNGADALLRARAKQGQIDVVLLDVTLPDVSGIEVARQIRGEEKDGAHVLIVGLTAHVGSVVHGSGLAAGMDHILIKPVRPSELRLALRDAKEGSRPRQQARNRMQTSDAMLNEPLVLELTSEMGRPATLAFMRRALDEAKGVFEAASLPQQDADLRARIHSAIGSAGLTGLSGMEYALRSLQVSAREGRPDAAALEMAAELVRNTELRLEAYAAGE